MAYKQLNFEIVGVAPLMMNNIRGINPLNPIVKEIKRITSKRGKQITEAEQELLFDLEWTCAIYSTKDGQFEINGHGLELHGDWGNVCMPSSLLEAMVIDGAKKRRLGMTFKAGAFVESDFELNFPNRQPVVDIFKNPIYRDVRPVKPTRTGGTILTTRVIFPEWSLKFTVNFLPDILNPAQIVEAIGEAGVSSGIGTYRPRFGRFEIKRSSSEA